jgi:hypothetical protein
MRALTLRLPHLDQGTKLPVRGQFSAHDPRAERILNRLTLLPVLLLGGCITGPDQRAVELGDLPSISSDYRARIAGWARGYYLDQGGLRDAALSDPVLMRDSTGRLLWLVCLDLDAGPQAGGRQLHAFGFAPGYESVPLRRSGASLTREDCAQRPLAWRRWAGIRTSR